MSAGADPPPGTALDSCRVAFKEWAGVCRALAGGRQSLILRKGGIEEGPGGFRPEHPAFWLYPTRVHQAHQGLKPEADPPSTVVVTPEGVVGIDTLAVVESVHFTDRLQLLMRLDGLHAWTAETVESRFHYRRPGLWVLGVRVFVLDAPVVVAVHPEHAGCKTWVPLDDPPSTAGLRPALGPAEVARRLSLILATLQPDGASSTPHLDDN